MDNYNCKAGCVGCSGNGGMNNANLMNDIYSQQNLYSEQNDEDKYKSFGGY